ncbi:MAG TPA: hypothetical protein VG324_29065, partial [Blastocatellia bacterium]|nr:hypothetical protein [Blastocatellia bacterium]
MFIIGAFNLVGRKEPEKFQEKFAQGVYQENRRRKSIGFFRRHIAPIDIYHGAQLNSAELFLIRHMQ